MSAWLGASVMLAARLGACLGGCMRGGVASALAALNVASGVSVVLLVTMTVAFSQQPFVDLAVVLAPLSLVGSLSFARYLERRR